MYQDAVEGIHSLLLKESPNDHIRYVTHKGGREMHHLTCYLPGVLMLGVAEGISRDPERDRQTAYQLTYGLRVIYRLSDL